MRDCRAITRLFVVSFFTKRHPQTKTNITERNDGLIDGANLRSRWDFGEFKDFIPAASQSFSFAGVHSSSETQGQLVGSIKCSWWKFTVRSRRAPGHLLLLNKFQKRLNCLLLIDQKKIFLANQRTEAAGWLSCFITRRSFPYRSP